MHGKVVGVSPYVDGSAKAMQDGNALLDNACGVSAKVDGSASAQTGPGRDATASR